MPFSGHPFRAPVMKTTHGLLPAPTKACSVCGGQWTKSHVLSGRSSRSIRSRHSPARKKKFSWFASLWYRPPACPGRSTAIVKPRSGNGASSPSKMHAAPSAAFVTQAASRTLTTNQPSLAGVRPASCCSSRASSTISSAPLQSVWPPRLPVREGSVCLVGRARLRLDPRSVAERHVGSRVGDALVPGARAGHEDHARPLSGADEDVLGAGWAVDEVPSPERTLLSLDQEQALAGEDEEVLLARLGVVEPARLARLEHGQREADAREPLRRARV